MLGENTEDEPEPYHQTMFNMGSRPHSVEQQSRPTFSRDANQHMLRPPPGLPHLPPLPPLPLSMHPSLKLPVDFGNHNMPLPGGLPQFMPPAMPQMMMNQVSVAAPSAPAIKPPTVPLDNYDPTETFEEKTREAGSSVGGEAGSLEASNDKKRKFVRVGGGQTWEDESLSEWDTSKQFNPTMSIC